MISPTGTLSTLELMDWLYSIIKLKINLQAIAVMPLPYPEAA